MMEVLTNQYLLSFLKLFVALLFAYGVFKHAIKANLPWITSVRGMATVLVSGTFCYLSVRSLIPIPQFLLIVSLVFNFYFLVKERIAKKGDSNEHI